MKQKIYTIALVILLCFTAFNSKAAVVGTDGGTPLTKEAIAKLTPAEREARLAAIKARIREIKKIDKSQMSDEDRKQLREELRSLRHQSSDLGGDIVIGAGAAVVVVLVLLLSGA